MINSRLDLPEMPRPLHSLQGRGASWANTLLEALTGVELFGVEKSFKMGPRQLLAERFLVGLQPANWHKLKFEDLFSRLAMPGPTCARLLHDLKRSNFLGLAFEEGADRRLFKAYVEFPVPTTRMDGTLPGSVRSHVIYHGYKWDPDRGEDAAVTRYWWTPGLTTAEIDACLTRHLVSLSRAEVAAVPRTLLGLCSQRAQSAAFQYLEAREDGSTRSSFDLNLYAAEIKLGTVGDLVRGAGRSFGIEPQALEMLLTRVSDRTLGHVSAGIDRGGGDFLTLYYEH